MEPADLARVISVTDPAVAPDGSTVAVAVGRIDLEANRGVSALWVVPVGGGRPEPVTAGEQADAGARWSPDGSRLAFTRTAKEGDDTRTSVMVVPAAGGEPIGIWTSTEEVSSLDWSPDGVRLAWCARVPTVEPGTADRDRPPRRIETLFARLDNTGWLVDRRQHVHVADTVEAGATVRVVTGGPFDHQHARWSPDGRSLVVVAARHADWDLQETNDLWLVDPDPDGGGPAEPRRVTDGSRRWAHPAWSPDGDRLAALVEEVETGWHNSRPVVVGLDGGGEVDLAPDVDRNFAPYPGARAPVWSPDGTSLLVSCEDSGRVVVWRLPVDGAGGEAVTEGDQVVVAFDAAGETLATLVATATAPAELEVAGARTSFTTEFVEAVPPRPVQRFTVASPAGDGDIDAWLVTPEGWDPDAAGDGARWPLLLSVHGGPMTQYGDRWFDEFQLLAGAGFVVVGANPHGSAGRSNAWQRAIRSPKSALEPGTGWGGIDADDLLAVLDATLERWPALDPERVGVLGGSYGGFMTTWLLARTDRFAAGCSERAVNNLLSEEWSSDVGGSFHRELGITHLDDPDEYARMSPVTYAGDITAPILILHSEQDLRCPTEQADALFVALRMRRHPDVEYWRFPGEGHEMSRSGSPAHRIRRAELINAFFERTIGAGPR